MASDPDPYRTLGLERGASLDDVKRAYRRLAKANHPDAAGEAALPRFLAIQAAYDQIAGPDAGRRVAGRGAAGPRRPWEADAERAGATHRAYGGRPRPRPGPRPASRPRPGPRPDRGERPSGSDRSGHARPDPSDRPDRPPKKATLGSTSYDDVDPEAFAPDWGGASWYGTTSGTYWTLNPKEYADPRKHGPEYQARARRAGGARPPSDGSPPDPAGSPPDPSMAASPSPGAIGVDAASEASTTPPSMHTTSSWWEATAGNTSTSTRPEAASSPVRPRSTDTPRPSDPTSADDGLSIDSTLASLRAWLDDDRPQIASRIGRAFIAWTPAALGIGWGAGELSGCGRFAATCDPAVAPISWVVQLALLGLLILLPRIARIGTVATLGVLGTVFPASVLLFATDPAGTETARSILGGLMVLGWIAGAVYGGVREVGRRARPVS